MSDIAAKAPGPFSVLIIEDDAAIRQLLRFSLEEAGYMVREAPNGRKGLHAFRQAPPDLVITDIFMPDRDGLEVIESLQRTDPTPKILAISGASGTMDYLKAAKAAGAVCVLRKPFTMSAVRNTIAALLSDACDQCAMRSGNPVASPMCRSLPPSSAFS